MPETATVNPGVGTGAGTPPVTTPSPSITFEGSPSPVKSDPGAGSTPSVPKELEFTFDEGDEPIRLGLEDESTPEELTFESLKSRFKEDDPAQQDTYKSLKKPLSENARFKKGFKTPEEMSEHLDRVSTLAQSLGIKDAEGLDAIERALSDSRGQIDGLRKGDAAAVKALLGDDANAPGKLSQVLSDIQYEKDPQGWSKHHADVMVATLTKPDQFGQTALGALQQLYEAFKGDPAAKKLLDRVAQTIDGVVEASRYKATEAAPNAEVGKLQTELQKAKLDTFIAKNDGIVGEAKEAAARKVLAAITKGQTLTKEARAEHMKFLLDEFDQISQSDKKIQKEFQAAIRNLDERALFKTFNSIKNKYMAEAGRKLYKAKFMPSADTVRNQAANKGEPGSGSAQGGAIKYSGQLKNGAPPIEVYDYPRMSAYESEKGMKRGDMLNSRTFFAKGKKDLLYW